MSADSQVLNLDSIPRLLSYISEKKKEVQAKEGISELEALALVTQKCLQKKLGVDRLSKKGKRAKNKESYRHKRNLLSDLMGKIGVEYLMSAHYASHSVSVEHFHKKSNGLYGSPEEASVMGSLKFVKYPKSIHLNTDEDLKHFAKSQLKSCKNEFALTSPLDKYAGKRDSSPLTCGEYSLSWSSKEHSEIPTRGTLILTLKRKNEKDKSHPSVCIGRSYDLGYELRTHGTIEVGTELVVVQTLRSAVEENELDSYHLPRAKLFLHIVPVEKGCDASSGRVKTALRLKEATLVVEGNTQLLPMGTENLLEAHKFNPHLTNGATTATSSGVGHNHLLAHSSKYICVKSKQAHSLTSHKPVTSNILWNLESNGPLEERFNRRNTVLASSASGVSSSSSLKMIGTAIGDSGSKTETNTNSNVDIAFISKEYKKELLEPVSVRNVDRLSESVNKDPNDEKMTSLRKDINGTLQPIVSGMNKDFHMEFRLIDEKGASIHRGKSVHDPSTEKSKVENSLPNTSPVFYHLGRLGRTAVAYMVLKLATKRDKGLPATGGSGISSPPSSEGSRHGPIYTLEDPEYLKAFFRQREPLLEQALSNIYKNTESKFPTLYQLLTHNSGLPEYLPTEAQVAINELLSLSKMESTTPQGVAKHLTYNPDARLAYPPGIAYKPSSLGYIILGSYLVLSKRKKDATSSNPYYLLSQMIQKTLRGTMGMKGVTYEPDPKLLATKPDFSTTEWGYSPDLLRPSGDPGIMAGDVGLYGTADDLAALAASLLDSGANSCMRALVTPRFTVSPHVLLQACYGGWLIDSFSASPESICLLSDEEVSGDRFKLCLFPSRGLGLVFVSNGPQDMHYYGYEQEIPFEVLKIVKKVYKNHYLDSIIPQGELSVAPINRPPPSKEVPMRYPGYKKIVCQKAYSLQVRTEAREGLESLLESTVFKDGKRSSTLYSILGNMGRVERLTFTMPLPSESDATNDEQPVVTIIRNGNFSNLRHAIFDTRFKALRLLDPIHRAPSEYIFFKNVRVPLPTSVSSKPVCNDNTCDLITPSSSSSSSSSLPKKEENSFLTGLALELDGLVFVEEKIRRTLDAYLDAEIKRFKDGIDPLQGVTNLPKENAQANIQFGGALLAGLGGMALGATAGYAYAKHRYPVWYYPTPIYRRPFPQQRVIIMGKIDDQKMRHPNYQDHIAMLEQNEKQHTSNANVKDDILALKAALASERVTDGVGYVSVPLRLRGLLPLPSKKSTPPYSERTFYEISLNGDPWSAPYPPSEGVNLASNLWFSTQGRYYECYKSIQS